MLPPGIAAGGGLMAPAGVQPREAVERFLTLWRIRDYDHMHEVIATADRERYTRVGFADLHARFAEVIGLTGMQVAVGSPRAAAQPPEGRHPDVPRPPPPVAPSRLAQPRVPQSPVSAPPIDSQAVVLGPVPGQAVPVRLTFQSALFGEMVLERTVALTRGPGGWEVRWTPAFLFPELGATGGMFSLDRGPLPTRGRILAADGTVLAETRADGIRVYPQETLAGQTVGYATPLTEAEAAARLAGDGYAAGQVAGRLGVEAGAESLLRGRAALSLLAAPYGGAARPVVKLAAISGADVTLTLRPDLQRSAEAALAPYPEAATAVVDPHTGDIWALASAPAFNPNAMTLGTTLAGAPLAAPNVSQLLNHATESAYPTGSSFKPFTLAAALQIGVATPATRMPCQPTWDLQGFTFQNYLYHLLPGTVSLVEAMAFSCNTTYMPLSMLVYERDADALTDLIADFGFGQPTGIGWVSETSGVLPDALWFEGHRRSSGRYIPFGPFDQVQLAIGQGSFLGTQLQMALAYAAFANRGTLWMPRLVARATGPNGESLLVTRPEVRRRIAMTPDQMEYLVTALEAVTTYSYGTGTAAFAGFGIPVAGKSGTAETGGPDPHALFPAFAPSDDPQIVVATLLARVHLGTGGSDAAPLVRRVMAAHFFP
ncbi:MAG TPA: penicillin-binding transpeptidase domain-containing protein [Candidatus Limnocylindria bacterium]